MPTPYSEQLVTAVRQALLERGLDVMATYHVASDETGNDTIALSPCESSRRYPVIIQLGHIFYTSISVLRLNGDGDVEEVVHGRMHLGFSDRFYDELAEKLKKWLPMPEDGPASPAP